MKFSSFFVGTSSTSNSCPVYRQFGKQCLTNKGHFQLNWFENNFNKFPSDTMTDLKSVGSVILLYNLCGHTHAQNTRWTHLRNKSMHAKAKWVRASKMKRRRRRRINKIGSGLSYFWIFDCENTHASQNAEWHKNENETAKRGRHMNKEKNNSTFIFIYKQKKNEEYIHSNCFLI